MKTSKVVLSVVLVFAAVVGIFLTGCDNKAKTEAVAEPYEKEIFALDTFINLRIYGENAESAAELANTKIIDFEKKLSVTDPESEVSRINSSGGVSSIDADMLNIIRTAQAVSVLTDGALDISVYPVVKLWGFTEDNKKVPEQAAIDEALQKVDYTKIIIDEDSQTVKINPNMQIDLGAVAKGYISEQIKNRMKEQGIESAVLSFGGNIQTIGTKNGALWKIGVKYPFTEESFAILSEEETAVVTSATDQRYFEEDGKMYHHIIDPKSGYPVDNEAYSVTVVCESGAKADALSTALFVMGADRAKELYRITDDFDFIILDKNDNVYVSEGLKDSFTLTDAYNYLNVEFVKK